LVGGVEGGDAAGVEFAFEVGGEGGQVGRGRDRMEDGGGGEDLADLGEVVGVIGTEVNASPGLECSVGQGRESWVDEAVASVFFLGPRVGEVDVEDVDGARGQEVFDEVAAFDADAAEVGQAEAAAFFVEFPDAPQESFDAEEVAVRVLGGVFDEEGGVTAAQFDFEGLGFGKEPGQVESFQDGGRVVEEGG